MDRLILRTISLLLGEPHSPLVSPIQLTLGEELNGWMLIGEPRVMLHSATISQSKSSHSFQ